MVSEPGWRCEPGLAESAELVSRPPLKWPAPAGVHPAGAVLSPQRRRPVAGDPEFGKRTCKPNSVVCGHSSRRRVAADARQRPTRRFRRPADGSPSQGAYPQIFQSSLAAPGRRRARNLLRARASLPIWSCSVWGLPCPRHYCRSGALLPHHFTLTGLAVQANALRASLPVPKHGRPAVCFLWHSAVHGP